MKDWNADFENTGSVWRMPADPSAPHVATRLGGKHVDVYFNSDIISSQPHLLEDVVEDVLVPEIDERGLLLDWVVTYAPYGLLVANACARAIGAQVAYVELQGDYGLSRKPEEGDSVLAVCDDLQGGDAVVRVTDHVKEACVEVEPLLFTLANMSGRRVFNDMDVVSAVSLTKNQFPEDDCPMCKAGSHAVDARSNWDLLQETSVC